MCQVHQTKKRRYRSVTLSNTNNEGWCGDGDQVIGCLLNACALKSKRRKMKRKEE